jgi:hypothetical protein
MMEKKKLGMMVAAAVVATGTVIGITALAGGAANAQSSSSITVTGMAQAGTVGSPEPEVLVSITCPAGDLASVNATATQGGFFAGHSDTITCTGNPQDETIGVVAPISTGGFIFAGPASAGAAMDVFLQPSLDVGTTATVTYP